MGKRRIKDSLLRNLCKICFAIILMFGITIFTNNYASVKAYDVEGTNESLTYFVISKQTVVYYDVNSEEAQEVIYEYVKFTHSEVQLDGSIIYSSSDGYVIRDEDSIISYFDGDILIDTYSIEDDAFHTIFIVTSNRDVFVYLYSYEYESGLIVDEYLENVVDFELDYDFLSVDRNYTIFAKQFEDNDVTTKIDKHYYFENLNNNFGINNTGSCTYVALGMLLGYYDVFENNNIIDNEIEYLSGNATKNGINGSSKSKFINNSQYNSFNAEQFLNSPGTSNAFHNYLVYEIGRGKLGYYQYGAESTQVDGLTRDETVSVLTRYLLDDVGLNSSQYNISIYTTEREIMNAIDNDKPVLIFCDSWSKDHKIVVTGRGEEMVVDTYINAGHALIAYGYEQTASGVFFKCHAGYQENQYNTFYDSIVLSFGDAEIDGLSLDLNTNHVCSNSYINNSSNAQQAFCPSCGNLTGSEYDIHCRTTPIQNTVNLSSGNKILLELNVDCSIQYDIDSESSKELIMKIFDENMNLIETGLTTSYNQKHFAFSCPLLDKGKFYVEIYFEDSTYSGDIDIDIRPHTSTDDYISTDDEVDVLTHLHENKNEFIISPSKSGLFLLELFAKVDGEYVNPSGEFVIRNSSGAIVQKMSLSEYNHPAESIANANNIMFYANQWGGYTIYLEVTDLDYEELILKVNEIEDFIIYDMDEEDKHINNSSIQIGDFAYIYNLERIGTYNISFEYYGTQSDEMLFVLFETNEQGEYVYKNSYQINYSNRLIELVEEITYSKNLLLCVFDSEGLGNLNIEISKELNNEFTIYGASDPSASLIYLTKGFQEICYLGADAPNPTSRYTYYNWYSTNESVINVSAYGTVTAVGVGEAKVQCVYKYDTSVVATLDFVVISDPLDNGDNANDIYLNYGFDVRTGGTISGTEVTSGKGAAISVSYNPYVSIHVTYTRLICLGSDSPNSSIQSFNWRAYREEDDTGMVNVSQFGTITGVTSGWVTVEGTYKYNSRYKIKIRIYVESNI